MSRPHQTSTAGAGKSEETWTDTLQGAFTSTSAALHHAVGSITGESRGNTGTSATAPTNHGTSSAVESHPFVSGQSSTTPGYSTGGTSDSNHGGTFGATAADKTSPATGVAGVPSTTSSAPNPVPAYNTSSRGETTTGMNTSAPLSGLQYDSPGNTGSYNNSGSTGGARDYTAGSTSSNNLSNVGSYGNEPRNTGSSASYNTSGATGSYGSDSNLVERDTSSNTTSAQDPTTSRGHSSHSHSTQGHSTQSQGQSTQYQTGTPTLTDSPSHTSNQHSDPSPNPSGPAQGGTDSSQLKSKDPSSSLPPPQSKGQGSATARGDAPQRTDESASNQRQVNQGNSIGSTSDSSSRLTGTQQSGPVSMSGEQTSHPGAGATPAAGAGAPVGDPSSGQAPKTGKQGAENPLAEPPKSKEDEQDEGTGQKYVKSSGVAAKGGDFDAANPGAGVQSHINFANFINGSKSIDGEDR